MKPSFHTRLLNGPFEDPGIFVRVLREGRAFIFDLGATQNLSTRDILKTTDIFVSHAHVDHFIGFDDILRVCLKKETPLNVYGPEGFIERVEGRLRGYSWNLTGDYPLTIYVSEVSRQYVKKSFFRAETSFKREDLETRPFGGVLMEESLFKISAAVLDHQIPCLAFSLEEDYHINIDKTKIGKLNLPVGPWLGELKMAIRTNKYESVFTIKGKTFSFSELKGIANTTRGQKIAYVVDAVGSEENVEKIVELVSGADVLYIEAYFLDKDKSRARDRYHLTAKEAGRIAREAGVGRLEVIHISPRYMDDPETVVKEAEEEFKR